MTTTTFPAPVGDHALDALGARDRWAKGILWVCALGAAVAAASAAGDVAESSGAREVAETWKLFGLPVFAGLFVLLARSPRRLAGLWELVIANKAGLTVAGATFLSDSSGGTDYLVIDGALTVLLITAYVLSRGWTTWTNR